MERLKQGKIMHPWTKAYRDVYSEDEKKTLFALEASLKILSLQWLQANLKKKKSKKKNTNKVI